MDGRIRWVIFGRKLRKSPDCSPRRFVIESVEDNLYTSGVRELERSRKRRVGVVYR